MKSPLLVLHKAEYDRIKALEYPVFDDHPQQKIFPYITMGEMITRDWSDKLESGQEIYTTKHLWSQYPGRKEVLEMTDAILQALTSSPLSLGLNFNAVLSKLDANDIIIDIDGITRHAILRLKYLIEEISE